MSQRYYEMCCQYRGKTVNITDRYGRSYSGRIVDVDKRYVYLESSGRNLGGFGWGFYGGYGPYGYYRPYRVALAAIAGIAIGGLLFW